MFSIYNRPTKTSVPIIGLVGVVIVTTFTISKAVGGNYLVEYGMEIVLENTNKLTVDFVGSDLPVLVRHFLVGADSKPSNQ